MPIACARPLANRPRAAWLVHGVSRKKTPARFVARARLALVEPSRASGGTRLTRRDPRPRKRGPKPTIDEGIGKVSPCARCWQCFSRACPQLPRGALILYDM